MNPRSRVPGACVVALDMGYGHLRAAVPIAEALSVPVLRADRAPLAAPQEQARWRRARTLYETLSRAAGRPLTRPLCRPLLDRLTDIPPLARNGGPEPPNLAARYLERLARHGLGAGLVERLARTGERLVTTFYAPALLADRAGLDGVVCVVTDSDVNRVWSPLDPARSRIRYCVPARSAADRLRAHGVRDELVSVTGFPLPEGLVGGPTLATLRRHLAGRLARLDPAGRGRSRIDRAAAAAGVDLPPVGVARPQAPLLTVAIGGAGAQREEVRALLHALAPAIRQRAVALALVSGTRPATERLFRAWTRAAGLAAGDGVEILGAEPFEAYLPRFEAVLARTDVLWTKPSELTFYGALGLPLLLARPLGVQERRNRAWALRRGAALDAPRPRDVPSALRAWLADGALAEAAWAGFERMPKRGTHRIAALVNG